MYGVLVRIAPKPFKNHHTVGQFQQVSYIIDSTNRHTHLHSKLSCCFALYKKTTCKNCIVLLWFWLAHYLILSLLCAIPSVKIIISNKFIYSQNAQQWINITIVKPR